MKRSGGPRFSGGDKKPNMGRKINARILLKSYHGGQLIGKGGSIIKGIRSSFDCRLDIPDTQHHTRVLQIDANDVTTLMNCTQAVTQQLQGLMKEVHPSLQPGETAIRLLLNTSHADKVRGSNDETIESLRNTFNCRVEVDNDCMPNSTDRVLTIEGMAQSVRGVAEGVWNFLLNESIQGEDKHYDPNFGKGEDRGDMGDKSLRQHGTGAYKGAKRTVREEAFNVRICVPSGHVGAVIGKRGSVINQLTSDHDCRLDIPNTPGPQRVLKVMASSMEKVLNCCEELAGNLEQAMEDEIGLQTGQKALQILIHTSLAGKLIGQGGELIKEYRTTAGCGMTVKREDIPNTTDRPIVITGGQENIKAGLKCILERLQDFEPMGPERRLEQVNAIVTGSVGGYGGQEGQQWGPPQQQWGPPQQQWGPPQGQWGPPQGQQWGQPQQQQWGPPQQQFGPPQGQWGPPQQGGPPQQWGPPQQQWGPPQGQQWGPPQAQQQWTPPQNQKQENKQNQGQPGPNQINANNNTTGLKFSTGNNTNPAQQQNGQQKNDPRPPVWQAKNEQPQNQQSNGPPQGLQQNQNGPPQGWQQNGPPQGWQQNQNGPPQNGQQWQQGPPQQQWTPPQQNTAGW